MIADVPNTCPHCGGTLTFAARVRLLRQTAEEAQDAILVALCDRALGGHFGAARECGKILGTVPKGEEES